MTPSSTAGEPPLVDVFWATAQVHSARNRLRGKLLALHDAPFSMRAREDLLHELADPTPLQAARRLDAHFGPPLDADAAAAGSHREDGSEGPRTPWRELER